MDASKLRPGTVVDGKRVRQAVDTHVTRWEHVRGRQIARGTVPIRRVTYVDGSTQDFVLLNVRPRTLPEATPGGPTHLRSKLANNATRVRASDPRWAGESGRLDDLRTHDVDLISRTNMYDVGRINGTVGVAR